ncbi:GIY-YIG nuclease family protein [Aquimarina aquimarini]|uniref:GIY-YIG nuclease family protein n=1 Tax=Aquimarina aquimarini TaxID=1191734 RepID=UPI000D54F2AF|nr:GIY-YIG nuclease family protein [Aquimarina aquimarini]
MKKGYVYILSNPEYNGLLKIGKTEQSMPEKRAKQLSKPTGIIGEFVVEWHIILPDCHIAEKMLHSKLSDYRFQGNREFYSIDLFLAIDIAIKIFKPFFYEIDDFEVYNRHTSNSLELDRVIKQLKIELGENVERRKAKDDYGKKAND